MYQKLRSQKFQFGGPKYKNFVTFFGEVMAITSLNWRHNWFFGVRFCHNQLEKPQFGQIT